MQLLGSLGIDIKLLIAQIINFGLLLWFLSKFLYEPIVDRIQEDEAQLKQAKILKKQLEKERDLFEEQKKKEIAKSKKRAREIIKEAEIVANRIKKQAQEEADKEKQEVIKQIKARLYEIENAEKSKQ